MIAFIIFLVPILTISAAPCDEFSECSAKEYLDHMNKVSQEWATKDVEADWNYASNLTDENLKIKLDVNLQRAKVSKDLWKKTIKFSWQTFKDPDLKRSYKKYAILGMQALPEEKFQKYSKIVADMESIYSKAKICDFEDKQKCDLSLEPELTEFLQNNREAEKLKYVWTEYRDNTGKKCKELYKQYVELVNEGARLNNFTNNAELWKYDFESDTFDKDIEHLWKQVEPFYKELHAYVRMKLYEFYGKDVLTEDGPIPAHLLGNMWGQSWGNINDLVTPFPDKKQPTITKEMLKQNYTEEKMFKLSESFFTSLNLSPMTKTFWKNSIIKKPKNVELICHASAWDFYGTEDFRIKMCTRINEEDLYVVHHEMGHIQYFMQYKDQPYIYREGANSGFHEAIGDVMALSVQTNKHLKEIGLLESDQNDYEQVINFLMNTALDKIAFIPFGYLIDQYRWKIFEGKITPDHYNCEWWKLREKYQGLEPPVDRSEEDFDAGAKYHVIADVPYVRYFVSFIIQFQFQKSLCEKAGQFNEKNHTEKPLYQCDIYKSKEAGEALSKMLKMGSSKPWQDAMEVITGQREMDASGLLLYFQPLYDWLKAENKKNNVYVGWKPSKRSCRDH